MQATSKTPLPCSTKCDDCGYFFEGEGYTVAVGGLSRVVCANCAEVFGWKRCDDCGKLFATLHDCGGSLYCEDCAESHEYAKCSQCEEWFERADVYTYDGDLYCNDCADSADLSHCTDCSDLFANTDLVDCDGNYCCEHCAHQRDYYECHHCNEWEHQDNLQVGADENEYCNSCWERYFTICERCDTCIWQDDSQYAGHQTLCSCCARESCEYEPNDFDGSNNTYENIDSRCFGVEIETDDCDDYSEYRGCGCFGAKPDGSINGKEFYSTILSGDKGLAEVIAFCKYANRADWSVNDDCGLHIHFDMRNETTDSMKAIGYAMLSTYDVWKCFVDSERHNNRYCHASNTDVSDLVGITNMRDFSYTRHRYEWLNFAAYHVHSTFEVRLHESTLDGNQVCNWIRGISLWMAWASRVGWVVVRNSLLCKDTAEKYDLMCQVWRDYGCDDLIEWFDEFEIMELAEMES